MSMVATIRKLSTEDLNKANASFDAGIQKIKENILGGVINIESENVNDNIVVSGIVQNEMNLSAINNWSTSLYSGISEALEGVSIGGELTQSKVKGSSILKLINTVAGATGYNISGTGPASKKIYQGSNLSGFSVTLKWYTPRAKNWENQITNLTSLAWPVYMGREKTKDPPIKDNNPDKSFGERVKGTVEGLVDIAGGAIDNLIARNPEKVMLTICYEGKGSKKGKTMYKMTPLVINSFSLQGSRETTADGVPVIVTATINFEYYQINASGSTGDEQLFAGAPIFATPKIQTQRTSSPDKGNKGMSSNWGSRVQVAQGSRSVRQAP